jgi:prepilin-type processing-associated H-X9-DG protein
MTAWDYPQAIVDHQASGVLELTWQDGTVSRLPHGMLRSSCRCAGCEQARRHGTPPASAADIRIAGMAPVGDKGLNLAFSDGHARGIYPWPYLHEIAQSL